MAKIVIALIKAYQFLLSPLLGNNCRFYPSCSAYAIQAIQMHGVIKGIYLSTRRVLRCHPGCEGGVDLVPEPKTKVDSEQSEDRRH